MWELNHNESWALKNWCFWTVVLEKTLECPLDCKEIQPVHPKGNQSWIVIGRTDAEAETPILWPPDVKNRLIWKDLDAGKDWGQENGTTEDEMVGWHHQLKGRESGWTLGVGDGQGGLVCCNSWGRKESDTTKRLNLRTCLLGRRKREKYVYFIFPKVKAGISFMTKHLLVSYLFIKTQGHEFSLTCVILSHFFFWAIWPKTTHMTEARIPSSSINIWKEVLKLDSVSYN